MTFFAFVFIMAALELACYLQWCKHRKRMPFGKLRAKLYLFILRRTKDYDKRLWWATVLFGIPQGCLNPRESDARDFHCSTCEDDVLYRLLSAARNNLVLSDQKWLRDEIDAVFDARRARKLPADGCACDAVAHWHNNLSCSRYGQAKSGS